MTETLGTHTYTYDAANRLTSVDGVPYTWDDRGNLLSDGTFTYAYNSAGRMARAESVTATLVYTYTAQGLRVAQAVDGDVTTFAWDWASGIPEILSDGASVYLVGHDTLGRWDGAAWAYYLPDALGSVRQVADGAGAVVSAREWTPYGVEVGTAQAGLGFTGEWWDASLGLQYLRARWYDVGTGRFVSKDPFPVMNRWLYADANPVNRVDPSGYFSNDTIAHSLGVSDFDEVIRIFRNETVHQPIDGNFRWGLLRLLQEAKINDTLSIMRVNTFGQSVFDPVGQFRFLNCEIWAGSKSLRGLLEDVNREDATLVMDWRRAVQAYYLNDQAFRDGYLTDLPDIATVSLDVDTWSPAWFAGGGFGGKLAYTVDRYGRAYFSIGGTASFGGGVPLNVVYSEGYVHRWQGGNHIASPGELETLIPGWDFGVGGTFLWWHAGAEVNLDSSIFSYLTGAFGFSPIPRIEIGAEGSYTWKFRHSVNPAGWYWIETIRCYEEKDIPRR